MSKSTTAGSPSAVINLQKKTDHHLMVIAIFIIFGFMLWFLFYTLGKQQIDQLKIINQEIQTTYVSDQNLAQINQFVDANSETLLKVNDFFPNEANIIETLESIEVIVKAYDEKAVVNITSIQPIPKDNQLQIPLSISLTSTLESFTKLLRELEKIPLMLQINTINVAHTSTNALQITLGVSLYVDDPFIPAPTNPAN